MEKIGIERAWHAIGEADAVLFVHDLTRCDATEYEAADAVIARAMTRKLPQHVRVVDVWNKADAAPAGTSARGVMLSAKTGAGLDALRHQLLELAGWQPGAEGIFAARTRHVQALRQALKHLDMCAQHLSQQAQALDLLAEELRLAQNAVSEITGEFTSDDLLGVIFSSFCIGK